ncbi:serine/threonine-protein phosphatase 2A regulatory subunit B'' subunit alpha isoform X1 [Petromyzon marinus]|uniref:serine/threonine-protein phosphatase 2A regulatory subunit B'' subunit alpha isoform X1 n=1 Tax=Petromyzon marinus TaxID=7757 RepID=UPI003F7107C7
MESRWLDQQAVPYTLKMSSVQRFGSVLVERSPMGPVHYSPASLQDAQPPAAGPRRPSTEPTAAPLHSLPRYGETAGRRNGLPHHRSWASADGEHHAGTQQQYQQPQQNLDQQHRQQQQLYQHHHDHHGLHHNNNHHHQHVGPHAAPQKNTVINLASGKAKEVSGDWSKVAALSPSTGSSVGGGPSSGSGGSGGGGGGHQPASTTNPPGVVMRRAGGRKVKAETGSQRESQLFAMELAELMSSATANSETRDLGLPGLPLGGLLTPADVEGLLKRAYGREGIESCLHILLRCSEDLKQCTEIIRRSIRQRKSSPNGGGGSDEDAETQYRQLVSQLSMHLRKLPTPQEGLDGPRQEALADFLQSLCELQGVAEHGGERPPRYEDVVGPVIPDAVGGAKAGSPLEGLSDDERVAAARSPVSDVLSGSVPVQIRRVLPEEGVGCTEALHIVEEREDVGVSPKSSLPTTAQGQGLFLSSDKQLQSPRYVYAPWVSRQWNLEAVGSPSQVIGKQGLVQDFPRTGQFTHDGVSGVTLPETGAAVAHRTGMQRPSVIVSHRGNRPGERHVETSPSHEEEMMDLERLINELEEFSRSAGCADNGGSGDTATRKHSATAPSASTGTAISASGLRSDKEAVDRENQVQHRVIGSARSTTTDSPLVDGVKQSYRIESLANRWGAGRHGADQVVLSQSPRVLKVAPASSTAAGVKDKKSLPPALPKPQVAPAHSLVPRFYFPHGRPAPTGPTSDQMIERVEESFTPYPDERADIHQMATVAKACGCPVYWKSALFHAASGERTGFVSVHTFVAMWRKLLRTCHDDSAKFVALLARPGCSYLVQEDFIPLLQDIVDSHPGLTFLKEAPEFHSRYITTVIQRVFYTVNRSWSGRISLTELRKSNFLQTLALLEEEEDINQITDYFSYEHFYVIYCKFWELDTDHDLYIDRKDLEKHNDHAISSRMIDRIFSGAVTRGPATKREKRMSYADFVWFLISEEDKKTATSVEYWFRCMDLDGDGVLSMYELEHFYGEQCARMDKLGIEPLPLSDCLCQMLDLVKPQVEGKITLKDLKRCRMAYVFFDTFFNLEKYLEHEQKDPFSVQKEADGEVPESSDWDRYAAEEYEILVAEESANQRMQAISYEEDLEEALLGKQVGRLTLSDPPNPTTRFSDDQYEYDDDFEY